MLFDRWKGYSYPNTRRYLRLPASWPVKCTPRSEASSPLITQTKDIGAGGVCLLFPKEFPALTLVDLEIHVPPLNRTILTVGQVVRSIPSREGRYELGIRFIQIDPKDQTDLNEAVENLTSHGQRRRFHLNWWRRIP